jgi:hypothetical protein
MTWRNHERSGERKLSRLSATIRGISGMRNMDLDMTAWNHARGHFTLFIEIKPVNPGRDGWERTRELARLAGCYGALVVEREADSDVFAFHAPSGEYYATWRLDDGELRNLLEKMHQEHSCGRLAR